MSKDQLVYDDSIHAERDYRHQLVWWIAEDEDYGGVLGEITFTDTDLENVSGDDRECVIACVTAAKTSDVEHDSHGFHWPTKAKAMAALKAIKLALKLDTGGKWPDWAIKASAAGWTPPKGWKP